MPCMQILLSYKLSPNRVFNHYHHDLYTSHCLLRSVLSRSAAITALSEAAERGSEPKSGSEPISVGRPREPVALELTVDFASHWGGIQALPSVTPPLPPISGQ